MIPVTINIIVFIALLVLLAQSYRRHWSLSRKVMAGLALGVLFGISLQFIYGFENPALKKSIEWFDIVGSGYVRLLQAIIMPLVFVSILSAVTKLHKASSLGKISAATIGMLLFTTLIAAAIGVAIANLFELNAQGLVQGVRETQQFEKLQTQMGTVSQTNLPQLILSLIPKNLFSDLTGASPTSIIGVVIFAVMLGIAALQLLKEDQEKGQTIIKMTETLQSWVMKLVRLVMQLTPYGVLALMTKVVSTASWHDIVNLGEFVIASYIAIGLMFVVHGILLAFFGVKPWLFFKKIRPVLIFAFTSRSSAASIPLNIEIQKNQLGVPEHIASFSASFGATMGQNGCAGIYPAMLAVMIAPSLGINTLDPMWIAYLLSVVVLSSIGIVGVGGGATFAALMVLPAMGLPVTLVALLISIEPLIDMGRTALNVSGAMTSGMITSQFFKLTNKQILENTDRPL